MKKKILFLSLILILQLGCAKDNLEDNNEAKNISIDTKAESMDILNKSEDISDIVVELFGIDNASTIIFNNKALISVIPAYDKELDEELRSVIEKQVLDTFSDIEEVKITDNKKIFSQTEDIIIEILQGSSYDNFVKEISGIKEKIDRENK